MSKNIFRQDDIGHILKLEELFYNRFLNSELLNELVSLYVKAIGFCNQKMSVMKVYFLEKMQFLLSRPQIQKLLHENQEQKSADKYTIKISSIQMQYQTPQYVRKSSLRSQPVLRKLAQINDQQQKIQQRQNRINQQLQQMRRQIQSMGEKFSQKINKKQQQNELISQDYLKQNISHHIKRQRRKSIRKNSLDLIVQKNQIIQSFSGKKIKKQEWVGWQRFINEKMKRLGIKQISKKKRVRFEQIQLMPVNKKQSQKLQNTNNLLPLHKTMKSFIFKNNQQEQIIEQQQQCHLIEIQRQKSEIKKSAVFYSLSYGTFAGGHNTPQLSETFRINTQPLVFPKPDDENLTDITQVSQENIVRVVGDINQSSIGLSSGCVQRQQQIQTVNNNYYYEKEYVDDEYF